MCIVSLSPNFQTPAERLNVINDQRYVTELITTQQEMLYINSSRSVSESCGGDIYDYGLKEMEEHPCIVCIVQLHWCEWMYYGCVVL